MKYFIFSLFILLGAVQIGYYYPKLPDQAESYYSKDFLCMFEAGVIIFLIITLFASTIIWLKYLSSDFISLPNKDYWLAPERLKQTKNYICNWMLVFGAATLLLLIYVFQLIINSSLNEINKLSNLHICISLGLYVVYSTIASILLVKKFTKIKDKM